MLTDNLLTRRAQEGLKNERRSLWFKAQFTEWEVKCVVAKGAEVPESQSAFKSHFYSQTVCRWVLSLPESHTHPTGPFWGLQKKRGNGKVWCGLELDKCLLIMMFHDFFPNSLVAMTVQGPPGSNHLFSPALPTSRAYMYFFPLFQNWMLSEARECGLLVQGTFKQWMIGEMSKLLSSEWSQSITICCWNLIIFRESYLNFFQDKSSTSRMNFLLQKK